MNDRSGDSAPFGTFPPTGLQAALMAAGRKMRPTWAGQRSASFIRSALKRVSSGPVDVEVLGQKMRLYPFDNASEKRLLATPQFFDPDELQELNAAVKPGFIFIDIGANAGTYALFVGKRAGASGRVLAVEPHPVVRARLQANLALNGLRNVEIAPVALSDHDGEITLHMDGQNLGSTSVHKDWVPDKDGGGISVPVTTLEALLAKHGFTRIDAIKIDVEGAEDQALMPFFANAPSELFPSLVIMEDGRRKWRGDLLELMQAKGYRNTSPGGGNLILRRGGAA